MDPILAMNAEILRKQFNKQGRDTSTETETESKSVSKKSSSRSKRSRRRHGIECPSMASSIEFYNIDHVANSGFQTYNEQKRFVYNYGSEMPYEAYNPKKIEPLTSEEYEYDYDEPLVRNRSEEVLQHDTDDSKTLKDSSEQDDRCSSDSKDSVIYNYEYDVSSETINNFEHRVPQIVQTEDRSNDINYRRRWQMENDQKEVIRSTISRHKIQAKNKSAAADIKLMIDQGTKWSQSYIAAPVDHRTKYNYPINDVNIQTDTMLSTCHQNNCNCAKYSNDLTKNAPVQTNYNETIFRHQHQSTNNQPTTCYHVNRMKRTSTGVDTRTRDVSILCNYLDQINMNATESVSDSSECKSRSYQIEPKSRPIPSKACNRRCPRLVRVTRVCKHTPPCPLIPLCKTDEAISCYPELPRDIICHHNPPCLCLPVCAALALKENLNAEKSLKNTPLDRIKEELTLKTSFAERAYKTNENIQANYLFSRKDKDLDRTTVDMRLSNHSPSYVIKVHSKTRYPRTMRARTSEDRMLYNSHIRKTSYTNLNRLSYRPYMRNRYNSYQASVGVTTNMFKPKNTLQYENSGPCSWNQGSLYPESAPHEPNGPRPKSCCERKNFYERYIDSSSEYRGPTVPIYRCDLPQHSSPDTRAAFASPDKNRYPQRNPIAGRNNNRVEQIFHCQNQNPHLKLSYIYRKRDTQDTVESFERRDPLVSRTWNDLRDFRIPSQNNGVSVGTIYQGNRTSEYNNLCSFKRHSKSVTSSCPRPQVSGTKLSAADVIKSKCRKLLSSTKYKTTPVL